MRYNSIIPRSVGEQIKRLEAHERQEAPDNIEKHLRHQPTRTSKSRIKRLKDCDDPQYRLRIGDIRVFYKRNSDVRI